MTLILTLNKIIAGANERRTSFHSYHFDTSFDTEEVNNNVSFSKDAYTN